MRNTKHSDGKFYRVYANYAACARCPKKTECTQGEYRQILRSLNQDALDIVDEWTRSNKALYRKRQEIAEHVADLRSDRTVKAVWGYKQFLCRTKQKICAEVSLVYLAYNMRRFVNIFAEVGRNPAAILGQRA